MNARNPVSPPFVINQRVETLPTEHLGTLTITGMEIPRLQQLLADHGKPDDSDLFGRRLVCETVTGPNGERFTVDQLAHLPAFVLRDYSAIVDAAQRVCGLNRDAVEKA